MKLSCLYGGGEYRNVGIEMIDEERIMSWLKTIEEVFPEEILNESLGTKRSRSHKLKEIWGRAPSYRAAVFERKEKSQAESMGVVILAGAGGTADNSGQMAYETLLVYNKQREKIEQLSQGLGLSRFSKRMEWAALVGSSVSLDTQSDYFDRDPLVRSIYQAELIVQMIEKSGIDELVLVGHSMGGQEMPWVGLLLSKFLVNKKGVDLVKGMVFWQAGGVVKQGVREFLTNLNRSNLLNEEMMMLFPTKWDIQRYRDRLEPAILKSDVGEQMRISRQIAEMTEQLGNGSAELKQRLIEESEQIEIKYGTKVDSRKKKNKNWPEGKLSLTELKTIFERMEVIDKACEWSVNKHLLKEREKLVKEIGEHMFAEFDRGAVWDVLRTTYLAAWGTLLAKYHKIHDPLPRWLAVKTVCPIAIVTGEEDVVFDDKMVDEGIEVQEMEMRKRYDQKIFLPEEMSIEQRYRWGKLFPGGNKVFMKKIKGWGHKSPGLMPEKFGKELVEVIERLVE